MSRVYPGLAELDRAARERGSRIELTVNAPYGPKGAERRDINGLRISPIDKPKHPTPTVACNLDTLDATCRGVLARL